MNTITMKNKEYKIYDVCCDYSLCDKVSDKSKQEALSDAYKWHKSYYFGVPVWYGWHKQYEELHYMRTDIDADNLSGQYV